MQVQEADYLTNGIRRNKPKAFRSGKYLQKGGIVSAFSKQKNKLQRYD